MSSNNNIFRFVTRTALGLGVATLFLIGLMGASAQQEAISRLPAGTSWAHARVIQQRAEDAATQLRQETGVNKTLTTRQIALVDELKSIDTRIAANQSIIGAQAEAIARSGLCPSIRGDTQPQATDLWRFVWECYNQNAVPDEARAPIAQLAAPQNDITKLNYRRGQLQDQLDDVVAQLASSNQKINKMNDIINQGDILAASYDEIKSQPLVGVGYISSISPVLVQIILCFLAGMFGALLVTLVISVYPSSKDRAEGGSASQFVASDSYGNRIFLGGLIAVGVFVMIGGGVSILGSSDSLLEGKTNFLSFCAIGILSGMFSDRFAGWLSRNADVLISSGTAPSAPGK